MDRGAFPTGIRDLDKQFMENLSKEEVVRMCSLNNYLFTKACDSSFFEKRVRKD